MKRCVKYLALVIMVVSILCTSVSAAVYTNEYISMGGAYIHRWGAGDISVECTVTGTDIMDTLGVHKITVYKVIGETPNAGKDTVVASYWYENYPDMMTTDEFLYGYSVRLNVEAGQRYYAVVVFYASLGSGGDIMPFSTKTVVA